MRLRATSVVVLLFLLSPTTAWASDHVASIFGALSFLSGSSYRGGQFGLEISAPTENKIHDYLGFLVDASVNGGTDAGNPTTKAVLLVGVRGLYRTGDGQGRLVLFSHLLLGGHRSHQGAEVQNGWAGGAGGGFDVLIGSTAFSGWAFRNQYDWVRVAGKDSLRASLGFAFRFKEPPSP